MKVCACWRDLYLVGWDTPEPIRSGRLCKTHLGNSQRTENPLPLGMGSVNSYGSDRRIDGVYHTASWQQDGLSYSIGCNDGDWTANDFFAAAQDVMETQP